MRPMAIISGRAFALGIAVSLVAALICATAGTWALDSPARRATLKGISSVYVLIEDLNPDAEQDGLTKSQLQADVELRLRQAGITVSPPFEGYLYVHVNAARQPLGMYAVAVTVEFRQLVTLMRDPTVSSFAGTWNVNAVTTVAAPRLPEMRSSVVDLVDMFINTYFEQNPKK